MAPVERLCHEDDEFQKSGAFSIEDTIDTTKYEPEILGFRYGLNATENMVLERETGIKFPSFLSCEDQDSAACCQVLVGMGINKITILKFKSIKVYAFGFYISPGSLRAQLGEKYAAHGDMDASTILEDILRYDLEMTVRLVIHHRSLKMCTVRSAFDTTLRNRLKKIKGVEVDEGLDTFNSYFSENLPPLSRGSVIDFQRVTGSHLHIKIDGRLIGTISRNDFVKALFDIYIGDPPVSLDAKHEIAERVCQLLRAEFGTN